MTDGEAYIPIGFIRGELYDSREDPYTTEVLAVTSPDFWWQAVTYRHPEKVNTLVVHDSDESVVISNSDVGVEVLHGSG